MDYEIDIDGCPASIDVMALNNALESALRVEEVSEAVLSVTVVDNPTIHRLNRDHLQHDYPTDVISFQLDWSHADRNQPPGTATDRSKDARIEGEIVASVEYAQAEALAHGWTVQSELTLYVIHGMLHICGYDDLTPTEKQMMRARESAVFQQLGYDNIPRRSEDESAPPSMQEAAE